MTLYTIGFTQKSAERFFGLLAESRVRRVIDVRLNASGQLAGFSKRDDLRFFLHALLNVEYEAMLELAPTAEMLAAYRKKSIDWPEYERQFTALIARRRIETLPQELFEDACLLCSEHSPDRCHRRIVAEYLAQRRAGVEVRHLA